MNLTEWYVNFITTDPLFALLVLVLLGVVGGWVCWIIDQKTDVWGGAGPDCSIMLA